MPSIFFGRAHTNLGRAARSYVTFSLRWWGGVEESVVGVSQFFFSLLRLCGVGFTEWGFDLRVQSSRVQGLGFGI